eukprot:m.253066 g.253066  ORF g.253066 m.253066 type:complete len:422 (+) comp18135_c0_seq1:29-1294(+)
MVIASVVAALDANGMLLRGLWDLLRLHKQLPEPLINPDQLDSLIATKKPFTLNAPNAIRDKYTAYMARIRDRLRAQLSVTEHRFSFKMASFFAIRLAAVFAALTGGAVLTIAVLSLQFVLLPYSLFVALAELAVLFPAIFAGHYLVNFVAIWALKALSAVGLPDLLAYTVNITPTFIFAFFVVDHVLCASCVWRTPRCPSAPVTAARLAKSVALGFLNCKTYFVILLALVQGSVQIPIAIWVLDAIFGLSPIINRLLGRLGMHWAALFYTQHILAHVPGVYQDAHRFHHALHDTTAFDAHIYGSGAPEEYFCLLAELLPAYYLGVTPPSLSYWVLDISWANKISHTRKSDGGEGANWHADHHVYHSKNYGGWYPPLDMYMGTAANNVDAMCPGYHIKVTDKGDTTQIDFTPISQAKSLGTQ